MKYEVYENKVKLWGLVLLMGAIFAGFLIPIVMYIREPDSVGTGYFLMFLAVELLLVWATVKMLEKVLGKKPLLILYDESIVYYPNPKQFIQFKRDDIEGIYPYSVQNQTFFGVILVNEDAYINELPNKLKRVPNINRKMGFPAFSIPINNIKNKDEFLQQMDILQIPMFVAADETNAG